MAELPGYYNTGTSNGEWYTPLHIVEKVRKLSGSLQIDLDPFSCAEAQRVVNARIYYTKEQDALLQTWPTVDLLFANPPYGRNILGPMVDRLVDEYTKGTYLQGIFLVNNATDTQWFHQLLSITTIFCIVQKRIPFTGSAKAATTRENTRGQIILYAGKKVTIFADTFRDMGPCYSQF